MGEAGSRMEVEFKSYYLRRAASFRPLGAKGNDLVKASWVTKPVKAI